MRMHLKMRRSNKKADSDEVRQRPASNRNVAPVFSYYSSRNNAAGPRSTTREAEATTKKAARHRRWLVYFPSLLSLVLVLGAVSYITTLSTNPRIEIKTGSTFVAVQEEAVYHTAAAALMKKSIFSQSKLTVDTDALAATFKDEFPELGDVVVVMPLIGRRAVFEIRPAQPALVLIGSGGSYIIDSSGRPVLKGSQLASSIRDKLPVVSDEAGTDISIGKQLVTYELVAFIRDVDAQFKAKAVAIDSYALPFQAHEVHVRLQGKGYVLKLNTENDARQQIGTYIALVDKLSHDGITPAEYIDVRIEERAYYK